MNYNGKDYKEIYEEEIIQDEWVEDTLIIKHRVFVSVPAGYDGVVFWLCDR